MVISISALNLGLVSALEENETSLDDSSNSLNETFIDEDEVVNYDDEVMTTGTYGSTYYMIGPDQIWNSSAAAQYLNLYCDVTGFYIGTLFCPYGASYTYSLTELNALIWNGLGNITNITAHGANSYADWNSLTVGGYVGKKSTSTSGRYWTSDLVNNTMTSPSTTSAYHMWANIYVTWSGTSDLMASIEASKSFDVALRTVSGGSLSSTVSKASAGSTVTVTASPSTGYSLSSATVSGATNVSVNFFKKQKISILLG